MEVTVADSLFCQTKNSAPFWNLKESRANQIVRCRLVLVRRFYTHCRRTLQIGRSALTSVSSAFRAGALAENAKHTAIKIV
jgi:hypothetical protein